MPQRYHTASSWFTKKETCLFCSHSMALFSSPYFSHLFFPLSLSLALFLVFTLFHICFYITLISFPSCSFQPFSTIFLLFVFMSFILVFCSCKKDTPLDSTFLVSVKLTSCQLSASSEPFHTTHAVPTNLPNLVHHAESVTTRKLTIALFPCL